MSRAAVIVLIGAAAGAAAWLVATRQASAAPVDAVEPGSSWTRDLMTAISDAGTGILSALPDPVLDAVLPAVYSVENQVYQVTGDRMQMSPAGLAFLGQAEGFRPTQYLDQAGLPTIGYGHLIKPGESFGTLTQADALALLSQDVKTAEDAVNAAVTVELSQSMFDALVSFVFNVGVGAFRTSTLLKKLNAGDFLGARDQFALWNKVTIDGVKQISAGLSSRRQAEADMFSGGIA